MGDALLFLGGIKREGHPPFARKGACAGVLYNKNLFLLYRTLLADFLVTTRVCTLWLAVDRPWLFLSLIKCLYI